jgi:hypothetical protein
MAMRPRGRRLSKAASKWSAPTLSKYLLFGCGCAMTTTTTTTIDRYTDTSSQRRDSTAANGRVSSSTSANEEATITQRKHTTVPQKKNTNAHVDPLRRDLLQAALQLDLRRAPIAVLAPPRQRAAVNRVVEAVLLRMQAGRQGTKTTARRGIQNRKNNS